MSDNPHDLPADWSAGACDLVGEVLDERADLAGADLAALWQVGSLVTAADALDAVARAAGYVSTGSTGQTITHPAAVESRLARTAAAGILARLSPSAGASRTTHARRAARARHGTGQGRR